MTAKQVLSHILYAEVRSRGARKVHDLYEVYPEGPQPRLNSRPN